MPKPCGTNAAYHRHLYYKEEPCQPCRDAAAQYQLGRMRKRGQQPYTPPECGTHSGYCRHIYLNEPACGPCKKAHSQYQVEWVREKRRQARRGTWQDVAYDYIETFEPVDFTELLHLISMHHDDVVKDTLRRSVYRLRDAGLVESRKIGDRVVWQSS